MSTGVYINMEMPTSCGECKFFAWKRGVGQHCAVDDRITFHATLDGFDVGYERNGNCPLVPVQPHGDLVDRNKLYEKTAEWEAQALHMVEVTMNDEDVTEWRKWSTVLTERSAFKFDIADAPTIIPAEQAEEGE